MAQSIEAFQISDTAADAYETLFVPRLFSKWAPHVVDAAGIAAGQRVLDVACGTGIVARTAADRLGGDGAVVGVDMNENMLAVARRLRPEIEWRQGDAARLPFADGAFDAVVCQSAMMFFPDPAGSLREMARVARPGGTVAVQVWSALRDQPAYFRLVEVAARHAGPDAVSLLNTYWSLGEDARLAELFAAAELRVTAVRRLYEPARFGSIDELVRIEVDSTPLGERITEEVYDRILGDARTELAQFRTADGGAEVPLLGIIVTARVD